MKERSPLPAAGRTYEHNRNREIGQAKALRTKSFSTLLFSYPLRREWIFSEHYRYAPHPLLLKH